MNDADRLSEIALAAKRFWGYPDYWISLWNNKLIVTPEFIKLNKVWVATGSEILLGFSAISTAKKSGEEVVELEHMWVLPSYMKKGIGKMLLSEIVKFCRVNHIRKIRIESDPNAKGFYEKMGARHVGYIDSIPRPRQLPVLEINI